MMQAFNPASYALYLLIRLKSLVDRYDVRCVGFSGVVRIKSSWPKSRRVNITCEIGAGSHPVDVGHMCCLRLRSISKSSSSAV